MRLFERLICHKVVTDLYYAFDEIYQYSENGFEINEDIIKLRTGDGLKDYFKYLIKYINKNINKNNIIEGLGELLTESQKDSVKATLLRDILFDLESRI